jgi:hypothetical protein
MEVTAALSINGGLTPGYPGLPIIATVLIMPRIDFTAGPVSLATDLQVQLRDASGQLLLPLTADGSNTPRTLDQAHRAAYLVWSLAPEETATLQAGLYSLIVTGSATITTSRAVGCAGVVTDPAPLQFQDAKPAYAPDDETTRVLILAGYLARHDLGEEALDQVDVALASDPRNLRLLEFKADVLADLGYTGEALQTYGQAVGATKELIPNEPNEVLLFKALQLWRAVLNSASGQ